MKTHLSIESSPREILDALTNYLPFISNITEILTELEGLGLGKSEIRRVLSGGSALIFGEVRSQRHSSRRAILPSAMVSICEHDGHFHVCINGFPIEQFIDNELERQHNLRKTTKEELLTELQSLRSTVKHSADRIRILEDHIKTLKRNNLALRHL